MAKAAIKTAAVASAKAKTKSRTKAKTPYELCAAAAEATIADFEGDPIESEGDEAAQRKLYERLSEVISDARDTGSSLIASIDWLEKALEVFEAGFEAEYGYHPADSSAASVTPKETITNRRNGYVTHFGPRRAFDGDYVRQVIAASGCSADDISRLIFCLQPLAENNLGDWTVNELLYISPILHEDFPPDVKAAFIREMETQFRAGKLSLRLISNDNADESGRHE